MVQNLTDKFRVELDERDVWCLVHGMKRSLLMSAKHCAMHEGWKTFVKNYEREYNLYIFFCGLLSRNDMVEDFRDEYEQKLFEEME